MSPTIDLATLRFIARADKLGRLPRVRSGVNLIPPRQRTWDGVHEYMERNLRIVDIHKRLIALRPNWIQREVIAAEVAAREAGRIPWFIILKYRKGGVTTIEQALSYWTLNTLEHQECLTLAHTQDDTRIIFRMVHRFYENQPVEYRPRKTPAETMWIEFPELDCFYAAATAGSGGTGRGRTLSRLHLSEAAHYRHLRDVHTGLGESVGPETAYVIESTANGREGIGESFYEFYQYAKTGQSHFIPLFFPWFRDPANRIALDAPDELEPLANEEQEQVARYGIDHEQLKWWRDRRKRLVADGRSGRAIAQEHPSDDETCFLLRSDSYYDYDALAACQESAREPIGVEQNGRLRIFEYPTGTDSYVFGCDTSEGIGGDSCAVVGFNQRTGEQALSWEWNKIPPDDFGRIVVGDRSIGLGWRWKTTDGPPAYVACERNNHGHAMLSGLIKGAGYPLDRIYHHIDETKRNKAGEVVRESRAGWPNNGTTHIQLTTTVGRMIRERHPVIRDREVLASISRVASSSHGAEFTGRDLAVAAGIAAIAFPHATEPESLLYIGGEIRKL